MSLTINVQSSVTKRFYQEVAIRDKQSIWRFEFRCAAAQKLRSVCKRALKLINLSNRKLAFCVDSSAQQSETVNSLEIDSDTAQMAEWCRVSVF